MKAIKKRRGRPPAEKIVQIPCDVIGITRFKAEEVLEKNPGWRRLKSNEELLKILKDKYPDCDIFNRKEISKTVGYQDYSYFYGDILKNTSTQSCTHLYKFGAEGMFIATAINSAIAGGRISRK